MYVTTYLPVLISMTKDYTNDRFAFTKVDWRHFLLRGLMTTPIANCKVHTDVVLICLNRCLHFSYLLRSQSIDIDLGRFSCVLIPPGGQMPVKPILNESC